MHCDIKADFEKSISFLLENANSSIKRRVKTEILHHITAREAREYQEQILQEPNIKTTLASQLPNGWFGLGFHGTGKGIGQFENQETCTKYLGEKAVDKDTLALRQSMGAFCTIPLDDFCYGTKGRLFDEFRYAANGQNLIRCACIARAGYDDVIDITKQIQLSLDSFQRVLEVDSILDITRPRKGKPSRSNPSGVYYAFNEYEKWPCRYHLDILAHTNSWKSEANCKRLATAIEKLMRTDRPELIGLTANSWVGYPLGALGCFPAQGLQTKVSVLLPSPIAFEDRGKPYLYQMEYMEWFARCGVVSHIPALQRDVEAILQSIDENGICRAPVLDDCFKGWGPYAGLRLETDWKTAARRDCDITFRALLIAYYANNLQ